MNQQTQKQSWLLINANKSKTSKRSENSEEPLLYYYKHYTLSTKKFCWFQYLEVFSRTFYKMPIEEHISLFQKRPLEMTLALPLLFCSESYLYLLSFLDFSSLKMCSDSSSVWLTLGTEYRIPAGGGSLLGILRASFFVFQLPMAL